jgi:hypothetical protein
MPSKRSACYAALSFCENVPYLGRSKYGAVSPAQESIPHIVFLRPDIQVRGIATRSIIASMKDELAHWNCGFIFDHPCQP